MEKTSAFLLLGILGISMISDLKTGKVKNWIIISGLVLSLLFQVRFSGLKGIVIFILGIGIPVMMLFLLFLFRVMGAGDIKLLSVVGGFLGPRAVFQCIVITFILGAVFALAKVLIKQNLLHRLHYLAKYSTEFIKNKKIEPYYKPEDGMDCVIHLTVPIFFSVILKLGGIF